MNQEELQLNYDEAKLETTSPSDFEQDLSNARMHLEKDYEIIKVANEYIQKSINSIDKDEWARDKKILRK